MSLWKWEEIQEVLWLLMYIQENESTPMPYPHPCDKPKEFGILLLKPNRVLDHGLLRNNKMSNLGRDLS